ncbi:hypothetical protein [Microbacterium sp. Root180]|uniref:hypothetical protein n=1 Tax=Microbacterium sp. Root180 TaxID=1736483 RepID=UPI0006FFEC68|nr:hypothetical protein [Microbacterium sp. Root180]KRB37863.1 hypothetical protein ASD93_05925 [Microbacterium sp. Root180]
MRSPDYTRLAQQLPSLYQEEPGSFSQLDAYLGLADELNEAIAAGLEDASLTHGPDAALRWPASLPLTAGADALTRELLAQCDDLAQWAAFAPPAWWGADEPAIVARRRFLARFARLWRRRGTPRGFVDWFSEYFGLAAESVDPDDVVLRPLLLEHFTVPGGSTINVPFTATLFVPVEGRDPASLPPGARPEPGFRDYERRLRAAEFARWYAPAHIWVRVCFVSRGFLAGLTPYTAPAILPTGASAAQLAAYEAQVISHMATLLDVLCDVVSVVDHAGAIHVYRCGADEGVTDQLGVGRLPHADD